MKKDERIKIRLSDKNLKVVQKIMKDENVSFNKALNIIIEKTLKGAENEINSNN